MAEGSSRNHAWHLFSLKSISGATTVQQAMREGYYAKPVTLPLEGMHGHEALPMSETNSQLEMNQNQP